MASKPFVMLLTITDMLNAIHAIPTTSEVFECAQFYSALV